MALLGTPAGEEHSLSEQDVEAMAGIARVLEAGFPLVALLQLVRVYARAIRAM